MSISIIANQTGFALQFAEEYNKQLLNVSDYVFSENRSFRSPEFVLKHLSNLDYTGLLLMHQDDRLFQSDLVLKINNQAAFTDTVFPEEVIDNAIDQLEKTKQTLKSNKALLEKLFTDDAAFLHNLFYNSNSPPTEDQGDQFERFAANRDNLIEFINDVVEDMELSRQGLQYLKNREATKRRPHRDKGEYHGGKKDTGKEETDTAGAGGTEG